MHIGTPGNNNNDDNSDNESTDSLAAANAPKEYHKVKILCQHVLNLKKKLKRLRTEMKSLIKDALKLNNERDSACRESSLQTIQTNGLKENNKICLRNINFLILSIVI